LQVIRKGRWEYAERVGANGAVAIVALTAAKEIVLVEQHRIPLDRPRKIRLQW
jgi:ADP-ribose pyrophosphatase